MSRAIAKGPDDVLTAKEVRKILLEIRNGMFYHHNGEANHKAVYLINIENAFERKGITRKPFKKP